MDDIKIDWISNGCIVHYKQDDVVDHVAYTFESNGVDGLCDGFLDMVSSIAEYLGVQGSKHDSIRVFLGYRANCSEKERIELQKKTDWEIV